MNSHRIPCNDHYRSRTVSFLITMALGLSPLVHGQLAMDPIKWPPYNPKLEYDFAKETAKIPAPKKVLDDGVVV